jgi:hypothetical protein
MWYGEEIFGSWGPVIPPFKKNSKIAFMSVKKMKNNNWM